jgi:hypothetical protein
MKRDNRNICSIITKKKLPIWAAVLIIVEALFLFSSEYVKYAKLEDTILD